MERHATLITGASRGIGFAVAGRLSRDGAEVVGMARRRPGGFPGAFYEVDFADAAATAVALGEATRQHSILRLVNNAGISHVSKLGENAVGGLDEMVAINVRALLQCIEAVLPAMRAAGFGRIVNIGSRASLGKEGRIVYGATKGAVTAMTRTAALEVAGQGITVNCVAPGPVETDMIRQNYPQGTAERARFERDIPMHRFGRPEEIAAAAAYFLSEEAGFTTGQVLYVCGGLSVGSAPT
jgi:NAD(P)-dependent dehydrogenase (short-subunit alcohol dehydrogenase family)